MSNLCRDESCLVLEDKIESVFGSCFSTHGLGGVLTCGVIGIKAGLSHSPIVGVCTVPQLLCAEHQVKGMSLMCQDHVSLTACGAGS